MRFSINKQLKFSLLFILIGILLYFLSYFFESNSSYNECFVNQEMISNRINIIKTKYPNFYSYPKINYAKKRLIENEFNIKLSPCPDLGQYSIDENGVLFCSYHGNKDNILNKKRILPDYKFLILKGISLILFSVAVFYAGIFISTKRYWYFAYIIPVFILYLNFFTRSSWFITRFKFMHGIITTYSYYIFIGFNAFLLFGALFSRLQNRLQKILIIILLISITFKFIIPANIGAALSKYDFEFSENMYGKFNICIQSTGYSCGPAAIVNVMERKGEDCLESQVAGVSLCNSFLGTSSQGLSNALNKIYKGKYTLKEIFFNDLDQMLNFKYPVAVIKYSMFQDHYVVILKEKNGILFLADPARRYTYMTKDAFKKIWRKRGLIVQNQKEENRK